MGSDFVRFYKWTGIILTIIFWPYAIAVLIGLFILMLGSSA